MVKNIIKVLLESAPEIITGLVIAALLAYIIVLLVKGKWDVLRAHAYRLITRAEQKILGEKKGRERFEYVLRELYVEYMPVWLRPFISISKLEEQIEKWVYDCRDILDDMEKNQSAPKITYPEEPEAT